MPLIKKAHIPSWPRTSYKGRFRTRNSSVALAVEEKRGKVYDEPKADFNEKHALTEAVQSRPSNHERVSFASRDGVPPFVGHNVGDHDKRKTSDTDSNTKKLGPVVPDA
jgi:hypothetical protein